MGKNKITCENCGFEEEVTAKQLKDRSVAPEGLKCEKCGTTIVARETAREEVGAASSAEEKPSRTETAKEGAKQAANIAKDHLKKAFSAGKSDPILLVNLLDMGMKKLCSLGNAKFDQAASISVKIGHYTILLFMLLMLVMGVILGIRTMSLSVAFGCVCFAILLIAGQYIAVKSFKLTEGIVANHRSSLSSPAATEILAIISSIIALCSLGYVIVLIINRAGFFSIGLALILIILSFAGAIALLHYDSRLNIDIKPSISLGEQLIGIVAAHVKTSVAVLPFLFGLCSAIVAISALWPLLEILIEGGNPLALMLLANQLGMLLLCVFAPLVVYVCAMILYLLINLINAILSLNKG